MALRRFGHSGRIADRLLQSSGGLFQEGEAQLVVVRALTLLDHLDHRLRLVDEAAQLGRVGPARPLRLVHHPARLRRQQRRPPELVLHLVHPLA